MELFKNITWTRRMTVTDVDTNTPTNLTGKTIAVVLKRRSSDAALITLEVGSGVVMLAQSGATLGQADFTFLAAATAGLVTAAHQIAILVDGQVVLAPVKVSVRDYPA